LEHKETRLTLTSFFDLGLAEPLNRALAAKEYHTPTPIQAKAIPPLLQGRDMIGVAQTGTGKTAAFGLPILHHLSTDPVKPQPRSPRALILAPTRELAIQIGDEMRAYGKFLGLSQALIYGGVGQNPQVKALQRGVDVLIATPGRLLDLIGQGHVRLERTAFLVLDEADRMLDMGFIRDMRKIIALLPKKRQSMLFSATMADDVTRLATDILVEPVRVEATPTATPVERIQQKVYFVETAKKRALLARMLANPAFSRVIVFTRTKHGANKVVGDLHKAGFVTAAIHGNKSQAARQKALDSFRAGKLQALVATDIAARGIDVDDVTHVINFDLPNVPDSYVHRIGRTARAGTSGVALSFCDSSERAYLRDIEKLIKARIPVEGGGPEATAETAPPRQKGSGERQKAAGARTAEAPARKRRRRSRSRSGAKRRDEGVQAAA
jgi:ATP-dependent RNA helicase RhlE